MNCSVCHGAFGKDTRVPLLLPACGHSLCRPCLTLLTTHKGFLCPLCRTKQPQVDVSSLHVNHALLEILTAQKEEKGRNVKDGKEDNGVRKKSTSGKDDVCEQHGGARLAYWCGPCQAAGCGECMVEDHTAGPGKKKHEPQRFDAALRGRRGKLQDAVVEVVESVERAEKRRQKTSVSDRKRLMLETFAATCKLRVLNSFLACQIAQRENEDDVFSKLLLGLNDLIGQVPPTSSSSSVSAYLAELRAVMEFQSKIEKFRDGPLTEALKEKTSWTLTGNQQTELASALALVNANAAALCIKVANTGWEEQGLEVTGGVGGRTWWLSWEHLHDDKLSRHHALHLHCLKPAVTFPTQPSRSYSVKWSTMQGMMHEVKKVFLRLRWGGNQKWLYFKLHHSTTSATTAASPQRRFIELLLGNAGDSFFGPPSFTVEEVMPGSGVKGIHLGTHYHAATAEKKECETEGTAENHVNEIKDSAAGPSLYQLPSGGDVICVRELAYEAYESDDEDHLQFWLVIEVSKKNNVSQLDCVPEAKVVGSLLPLHHNNQLGKLLGSVEVKVADSGVLLLSEGDEEEGDGARAQRAKSLTRRSILKLNGSNLSLA